jgi:hypothetical protein
MGTHLRLNQGRGARASAGSVLVYHMLNHIDSSLFKLIRFMLFRMPTLPKYQVFRRRYLAIAVSTEILG